MSKNLTQILMTIVILAALVTIAPAADFNYSNDSNAMMTLNRIAGHLAQESNLVFTYRILIQHYPQVNAFSTPDGCIVMTLGLLKSVNTEEELAGAIAHEMGHLIPSLQRKSIRNFAGIGSDEYTADKLGIQILEKAGYNPTCLARMLGVILEQDGSTLPKAQAHQISDRIHKIEKKARNYKPVMG